MHKSSLADSMARALMQLAQEIRRCHQLFITANKDEPIMWSSNILDLPAHWRFIAHNSRNNRRTKRKK